MHARIKIDVELYISLGIFGIHYTRILINNIKRQQRAARFREFTWKVDNSSLMGTLVASRLSTPRSYKSGWNSKWLISNLKVG